MAERYIPEIPFPLCIDVDEEVLLLMTDIKDPGVYNFSGRGDVRQSSAPLLCQSFVRETASDPRTDGMWWICRE